MNSFLAIINRVNTPIPKKILSVLDNNNIVYETGENQSVIRVNISKKTYRLSVSQMFHVDNPDATKYSTETSLIKNDNIYYNKKIGYEDTRRFSTPEELLDEIYRLKKNYMQEK
jgi:hypothetical protein